MHEFFERLVAFFVNSGNDDQDKAKQSSLSEVLWKFLFENVELSILIILLVVAGIGLGLHRLASELARRQLPEGCPPLCVSAQLAGLNLRKAELEDADLSAANLSGTVLSGATPISALQTWRTPTWPASICVKPMYIRLDSRLLT